MQNTFENKVSLCLKRRELSTSNSINRTQRKNLNDVVMQSITWHHVNRSHDGKKKFKFVHGSGDVTLK
jgi:hypothetical protein